MTSFHNPGMKIRQKVVPWFPGGHAPLTQRDPFRFYSGLVKKHEQRPSVFVAARSKQPCTRQIAREAVSAVLGCAVRIRGATVFPEPVITSSTLPPPATRSHVYGHPSRWRDGLRGGGTSVLRAPLAASPSTENCSDWATPVASGENGPESPTLGPRIADDPFLPRNAHDGAPPNRPLFPFDCSASRSICWRYGKASLKPFLLETGSEG